MSVKTFDTSAHIPLVLRDGAYTQNVCARMIIKNMPCWRTYRSS